MKTEVLERSPAVPVVATVIVREPELPAEIFSNPRTTETRRDNNVILILQSFVMQQ